MKARITTSRRTLLAAATLALATASHAAIVITFQQVGGNIVETGSGSANLTALSLPTATNFRGLVSPTFPEAAVGSSGATAVTTYSGISGPSNFGSGSLTLASSGTGSTFGFQSNLLVVPLGYVSGTSLSGSSTFNGATFASLGILAGIYTWTWGAGATADSLTVNAIAAVPEPGSALAGMLALGACATGLIRRNRQSSVRQ